MAIKIVLDPESEGIARRLVKAGLYDSVDEAVRAGLRLLEEQEPYEDPASIEDLRTAIAEGRASGPDIPAEEVFAELRAKIRGTSLRRAIRQAEA